MTTEPESGVRTRTRQAIVSAAIAEWARDFAAPLSAIAERAEVSRSTLHRYFVDRQSLIDAALREAQVVLDNQSAAAVSGCNSAREELESLMRVLVDFGDILIFLFADPNRFAGNAEWIEAEDEMLPEIIRRAQVEGAVADDVEPSWVIGVYYSICYTAASAIATDELSRLRAADIAVRTFFRGVAATPATEPGH
ncbi:TetR/AcrR family transcriptional regulator [Gordonia sp. PKS22-38]|uniref:TetR/AcrR family transcriptional regulator n=1 Tax=Gordonia prachuapensis TaxID=3115651 RepID=A0ABU7MZH1_9ACTN|nr:TetR/AcrR family transcriptional regulator [Gordonia sp. PKS22-38]